MAKEVEGELAPIIVKILRWSCKYDPATVVSKKVKDRIKKDRGGFIAGRYDRLEET